MRGLQMVGRGATPRSCTCPLCSPVARLSHGPSLDGETGGSFTCADRPPGKHERVLGGSPSQRLLSIWTVDIPVDNFVDSCQRRVTVRESPNESN